MENLEVKNTAEADQKQVALVEKKTSDIVALASIKVVDQSSLELAGKYLQDIKALKDEVVNTFADAKDSAHKTHKAICEAEKKHLTPLETADKALRQKVSTYQNEQERIRREAEQRAAEERRLAAEIARKSEADAAALAAELGMDAPAPVHAVPVVADAPVVMPAKVAGLSFRDNWKAEVTDLMDLVKAVAAGTVPLALVLPNQTALNQQAQSLKDAMNVPGVRVWNDRGVSVR